MFHIKRLSPVIRRYSSIDSKVLLSEENLTKCLECLRGTNYPTAMTKKIDNVKYAAVLIPICQDNSGDLSILYTRRSKHLRRHTRQISFPGKYE